MSTSTPHPSWQSAGPALVLASGSAARAAVMRSAGLQVATRPAHVDEDAIKRALHAEGAPPGEVALALAGLKARQVAAGPALHDKDALIIGADQMLSCDGDWFDKPKDREEVLAQLRRLRGRTHVLHSAIVCWRHGRQVWQHVATPRLSMRAVSDATLDAYLDLEGDAVLASVGAYRIEGPGLLLFERIEGEHNAILGLPMLALCGFLRQHGILPD